MRLERFVIYGIFIIVITGCTQQTVFKIRGVDREKVARVLWEYGSERKYHDILGPESSRVWPDHQDIDLANATMKYQIDTFMMKTYGKDTVKVLDENPNEILVSLRCEDKDVLFNFCWGLLSFYTRDLITERDIMFKTALQLKDQTGSSVEWVGNWRPANLPQIVTDGNSLWVAYKGVSTKLVTDYLNERRYRKAADSARNRIVYQRDLIYDPDGGLFSIIGSATTQWRSRERIVTKTIGPDNGLLGPDGVLVIGAAAIGIEHVSATRSWLKKNKEKADLTDIGKALRWIEENKEKEDYYRDVGSKLRQKVIYDICANAAISPKGTVFVDPSPWIEGIELPPLETVRQDIMKEAMQEYERFK